MGAGGTPYCWVMVKVLLSSRFPPTLPEKREGGMVYYLLSDSKSTESPMAPTNIIHWGQITLLMPKEMKVLYLVLYLAFSDTTSVVEEGRVDHLIITRKEWRSRLTIQPLLTWMGMRPIFPPMVLGWSRVVIAQKFSVLLCCSYLVL